MREREGPWALKPKRDGRKPGRGAAAGLVEGGGQATLRAAMCPLYLQ